MTVAQGVQESLLYAFVGRRDGENPYAALVIDQHGSLYGTTAQGGGPSVNGFGTVFKLTPTRQGLYKESILHRFADRDDGHDPMAGLMVGAGDALYGATYAGGNRNECLVSGLRGCGTVFRLTLKRGSYTEAVLYAFRGGNDGMYPQATLIEDRSGALYGTTTYGGGHLQCSLGCGTVFKLAPNGGGAYTETVIYAFQGQKDGGNPHSGLIADGSGALYGTTAGGGNTTCAGGCGTVFKLTPNTSGYSEKVLYAFRGGKDGASPWASLVTDARGSFFGTTFGGGGVCGCGTVFELKPKGSTYEERVLTVFVGSNGSNPAAPLLIGPHGTFYGATSGGGSFGFGGGAVFQLRPKLRGYVESVLYSFQGQGGSNGGQPMAGLIADMTGALYGTTAYGGNLGSNCVEGTGCGVVFRVKP